eukprot:CAMPEP_0117689494 /NCGR_PEP_ID=MMETSP0804-20121206/24530_1 /TAXON_ID=1074897 /ORGANISM="Tetraselmis astigmatica, Strain CCMP880" /LENGTH=58 /DNA_ID=CAMNT_0005502291 /DNA_START=430 /DNA_END=606 /DNA_ORIENTATION=+
MSGCPSPPLLSTSVTSPEVVHRVCLRLGLQRPMELHASELGHLHLLLLGRDAAQCVPL